MAFIASQASLQKALNDAQNQAAWIKGICQQAVISLTGTVDANFVFQLLDNLRAAISMLNADAAVPGIAAYAQAQFSNSGYNISAEFTAMVNDLNSVVSWVVANFPKDTGNFLQAYTINADGSRTAATFTSAQTAGLTSALNTVIAEIS